MASRAVAEAKQKIPDIWKTGVLGVITKLCLPVDLMRKKEE